jgi:hypothetical protein
MSESTASPLPDWALSLGLIPHPEGGWFRETWRSGLRLPADAVAQGAPRDAGTAILYLLAPGERSAWHRVSSDELWIHQRGGPLRLDLSVGVPSALDAVGERHAVLGSEYAAGEQPQVLVPAGLWQAARPIGSDAVLVACVVVPGFDFADFTLLPGTRPAV